MIDLKSIRDRIIGLDYFLSVADSPAAAEAMEQFNALPPAAFVSTASERADPNMLATGHRQRVNQTISVLFVIGAERASRDNVDPMEEARSLLLRSLVAWTPQGSLKPLDYVSYSLRFIDQGLLWGELLFIGTYTVSG